MTIRCEIVSQDRTVFQGDVDIVVLPGAAGEMGILPHHAPVLAILKDGVIKVRRDGKGGVAGGDPGRMRARLRPAQRSRPSRIVHSTITES